MVESDRDSINQFSSHGNLVPKNTIKKIFIKISNSTYFETTYLPSP